MAALKIGKPKKAESNVESLINLFELLAKIRPASNEIAVYRGHADKDYILQPSLFRKKEYRKDERSILRELISIQPTEFRDDRSSFEQLVRMQHYGMPTRLLDFTFNPLVALFFASANSDADGELLQFTFNKKQIKFYDSDTVSCISNLSNLDGRERDQIRKMKTDEELKNSTAGLRLLHFIKAEKPYFLEKIQVSDLSKILAVRPKQTNRRIIAQQGGFFLFGLRSTMRDANELGINVTRLKVVSKNKDAIRSELDQINIHGSALFPEIESAAKYILSKIPAAEDAGFDLEPS